AIPTHDFTLSFDISHQQLTRDVCPCLSSELPEQNLDTEVRREQSVACGNKRLKHAATTNSGLVVSPGNANLEGYYSGSSSDCDIGLLKADTASPSWKAQALRTWSV
ncbi:Os03g0395700, partial [Oryza sativa Japonica Group]